MSKGTTRRSIRIEDELWQAAQEQAQAEGRNVSDIIREALEQYVKQGDK